MSELTPGAAPGAARRDFSAMALIVGSTMVMAHLDATMLATALPTMARSFAGPLIPRSTACRRSCS